MPALDNHTPAVAAKFHGKGFAIRYFTGGNHDCSSTSCSEGFTDLPAHATGAAGNDAHLACETE